MQVGIDRIGFYTPNKYVDMTELAQARGDDPNKYLIGIGQSQMSLADQTQDAVSMGINATLRYANQVDMKTVDLLIMGTESGVDQSKSASLFVKSALKLSPEVRTFEIKEACFGMTAGMMIACDYVRLHPQRSAIVIGSDLARYGLGTSGEVTQGAGSVSVLIKANPGILTIGADHSAYSSDINDFWRPNDSPVALVDGKYSTEVYLDFFKRTFADYQGQTQKQTSDFAALIYHLPFTKMGYKANRLAVDQQDTAIVQRLEQSFTASAVYSREVGNIYTASLYLSLLSLLENGQLKADNLVGLFSYGSGAMGEFYAGQVVAGYTDHLNPEKDLALLQRRQKVSVAEYEHLFNEALRQPEDNVELVSDEEEGYWYFAGCKDHVRQYKQK
ncbi:hydroxymethylglutaryl-CoA synthase [Lactobacillus xylocopicola]|uniref:Hydroxymethylglutaryl-CoA synthase n=1 Tax=Lactobacillus xylocopicola TaxID=2976676 RepID=A0ABM8BG23_9LACO|nr:hydroxymethylglutaryl-CoA synthase [Lactobacillus xylocopicola]BDR60199.1 hydroxymethylglutaryl-CoA synthase [Lactobacillus xylocopicola]